MCEGGFPRFIINTSERVSFKVQIKLPEISLSTETWITLIEQFLMLILIIGRWMLPKGDLTRDQLSQLLLVYIGKTADCFANFVKSFQIFFIHFIYFVFHPLVFTSFYLLIFIALGSRYFYFLQFIPFFLIKFHL